MSFELFKHTFKRNWILLLIFFGVLTMYLAVMTSMYDPNNIEALAEMLKAFPENMAKSMGFSNIITSLTTFLASWLYGMLMYGFPMVYCIILGNGLVAKMVDNGSFAYLLSTPNSRVKIIVTQGVYALFSVFLLFAAVTLMGVVVCEWIHPGQLQVDMFIKLNFITMLVNMVVIMITFLCSTIFSDAKFSLGLGAGIPICFLMMNMLGGSSPDAKVMRDLSIYGLYNPIELVEGLDVLPFIIFYCVIIVVLFVASVLIFRKKRLSL